MSTHSIGFYEDLTEIIFELSSNIIKYAPYFCCWDIEIKVQLLNPKLPDLSHGKNFLDLCCYKPSTSRMGSCYRCSPV